MSFISLTGVGDLNLRCGPQNEQVVLLKSYLELEMSQAASSALSWTFWLSAGSTGINWESKCC